jgi:general secretion pathway protein L
MPLSNKSSIFEWWFQGLTILIPDKLEGLLSPKKSRVLLQLKKEQLIVIWPETKENRTQSDQYVLQQPSDLKKLLKKVNEHPSDRHDYVLSIPANKGLKSNLKLPVSAEAELASILAFEIDRQTPFTSDQVYYGYKVNSKDVANNALNVELNVIPKKMVDTLRQILIQIGLAPQIVELAQLSSNDSATLGINVLPREASSNKNQRRFLFNMMLSALAAVLLLVAVTVPFIRVDSALKQVETDIEASRIGAQEVNVLRTKWEAELKKEDFAVEKIDSRTSLTELLYELTKLIPDNTWLTRIHLKEDTIRLQGESSSATSLISIIDQSDQFNNTRFQSPVTSNNSTGKDRFQITSKVLPKQKEITSEDEQ